MFKKFLVFLFLFFLCSCSKVVNGVVVKKEYNSSFTTYMIIPISCGKNCNTYLPVPVYYPPSWDIVVEGTDKSGEYKKSTFYISENKFNLIMVGDKFGCGEKLSCPESKRTFVRKD
jgi:hypothetical protein